MAKIKFLTDSASDIPKEILDKYPDIEMVPFPVQVGEDSYEDRVTISPEDFYEILEDEDEIPTHSQITPFQFGEIFIKAWKDGYTHLIYTSINGRGSATYQNAVQEANSFFFENPAAKDKIEFTIIDSKNYTLTYGYAVMEGARMAQEKKSHEEIVAFMKDWVKHAKVVFVPFTLKYAKKSGRVKASAAFVGEALGMKPLMTFQDGESKVLAKVRGEKNVVEALIDMVEEDRREGAPYCIMRTSLEDYEDDLIERLTDEIGEPPAIVSHAGCTIAANAGPKAIGVIYRKEGKGEDTSEPWAWKYVPPKPLAPGYIR